MLATSRARDLHVICTWAIKPRTRGVAADGNRDTSHEPSPVGIPRVYPAIGAGYLLFSSCLFVCLFGVILIKPRVTLVISWNVTWRFSYAIIKINILETLQTEESISTFNLSWEFPTLPDAHVLPLGSFHESDEPTTMRISAEDILLIQEKSKLSVI